VPLRAGATSLAPHDPSSPLHSSARKLSDGERSRQEMGGLPSSGVLRILGFRAEEAGGGVSDGLDGDRRGVEVARDRDGELGSGHDLERRAPVAAR
jgi:hypothetical protein